MDRTNILRLLLGATLAAFVAATAYGDAQKVPPDAASGGGIAASDNVDWTGTHTFLDGTYFSLKDDVDPTKILRFQLSGITTGTVRTITVPDANLTLPTAFIGGSTGSTDNAILRADGTGGSTVQAGTYAPTYDDDGDLSVVSNVAGVNASFGTSGGSVQLGYNTAPHIGASTGSLWLYNGTTAFIPWNDAQASLGSALVRWLNIYVQNLYSGVPVEANTGTKSVSVYESGECYTNTGDTDGSTINLPNDPAIGRQVCVLLTASQSVTVAPAAGETISDAGTTYSTSCVADALGESITLVAATGGSGATWVPRSKVGTWTCS